MNIDQLNEILTEEKISKQACLINPRPLVEGALCLNEQEDGSWLVILNERGNFLIHQSFSLESDACRFVLKHVLSDPTYREDFKQSDLFSWKEKKKNILEKYELE
ncbi:MAG: hypothetical protein AB1545_13545 [Thermodesulfobacteriota bacterium]